MDRTARLAALYTGAVYDVLRAHGYPNQALPSGISSLDASRSTAGPVFTLTGEIDESLGEHDSLLMWTGFLSAAPRGAVVVCQPNDDTVAHMGELSAETLGFRGIAGYIVDGGCRDVNFIVRQGFPVWCRYTTPRDIVGRWAVRGMDVPIQIGTVTVSSGDYVLADRDGVLVIPVDIADGVIEEAERVVSTENLVRSAILRGIDPQDAYLQYGKF